MTIQAQIINQGQKRLVQVALSFMGPQSPIRNSFPKADHLSRFQLLGILFLAFCSTQAIDSQASEQKESLHIKAGDLSVIFRDNSQSPQTLSGLQSLFNVKHAPEYDAFDRFPRREIVVDTPMSDRLHLLFGSKIGAAEWLACGRVVEGDV